MENSPNHQGSDPPLYDPPPSYEDVIKLYLPPPPPYSSIGRGRTRNNNRCHSNGVENRGYRNDRNDPNGVHGHTRRSRGHHTRLTVQDSTHPMILKVSLPEEVEPPTTPSRENICDRNSYEQSANFVSPEESTSMQENITQNVLPGNSRNERDMCQKNNVISQANSSLIAERGDNEHTQSCECQGACSCKLLKKKKVARCSSESRVIISSNNTNLLGSSKASVTKKRSFKDMMHKSISRASSSAIIPHPASMTITVRPPVSKKAGKQELSKSAGPSSPTSKTLPEVENSDSNEGKTSFGHSRSSSGPNLVSQTENPPVPQNETFQKSMSDNQILDASNLSQVKHLASVLFDGLQHSFSFKNEEVNSFHQTLPNDEDKTKTPVLWTNLLIPSRKKTAEQDETSVTKNERQWTACDTLPLLSSGSQSPAIVKFEDKNLTSFKSLDNVKKFEDTPESKNTD